MLMKRQNNWTIPRFIDGCEHQIKCKFLFNTVINTLLLMIISYFESSFGVLNNDMITEILDIDTFCLCVDEFPASESIFSEEIKEKKSRTTSKKHQPPNILENAI